MRLYVPDAGVDPPARRRHVEMRVSGSGQSRQFRDVGNGSGQPSTAADLLRRSELTKCAGLGHRHGDLMDPAEISCRIELGVRLPACPMEVTDQGQSLRGIASRCCRIGWRSRLMSSARPGGICAMISARTRCRPSARGQAHGAADFRQTSLRCGGSVAARGAAPSHLAA